MKRIVWFSCGAASAVAAKMALARYEKVEVVYCDTFTNEHPDNKRFFNDIEIWLRTKIKIIRSELYHDIYDVFEITKFLVSPEGARCSTELKKLPRLEYQDIDDIHTFGYTIDEEARTKRFIKQNFDLNLDLLLYNNHVSKADCFKILTKEKILLPMMYRLGYKNNNCIGCVKGGKGYWNKIREDFPEVFIRMARVERKLGISILRENIEGFKLPLYLDTLDKSTGNYKEEKSISCGPICSTE